MVVQRRNGDERHSGMRLRDLVTGERWWFYAAVVVLFLLLSFFSLCPVIIVVLVNGILGFCFSFVLIFWFGLVDV